MKMKREERKPEQLQLNFVEQEVLKKVYSTMKDCINE